MTSDASKSGKKARKPMARGSRRGNPNPTPPPIEHRWKPGQSGNPKGGPKQPAEMKRLKQLTKGELVEVGTLVVKGDVAALKKVAKDKKSIVLHAMVAAIAVRIMEKGDMSALDILLNRLIGKVRDEVLHTGNIPQVVVTLPSNGRETLNEPAPKRVTKPVETIEEPTE